MVISARDRPGIIVRRTRIEVLIVRVARTMSTGATLGWVELVVIIGRCTRIHGRIMRVARPMFGSDRRTAWPAGLLGIIVV
jgi:hypothetical protein